MFGSGVADFPEAETLRYAYPSRRVAVACAQDAEQVTGTDLAGTDVDQCADDRAHHLPAERSRGDVVAQHAVAEIEPRRLEHAPHRRRSDRALATEGGE